MKHGIQTGGDRNSDFPYVPALLFGRPSWNYVWHAASALALVDARDRTTVYAAGPECEERRLYPGSNWDYCDPNNTLDKSLSINSRWSCKGDILDDDDEGCWIEYYFGEPQDIVKVKIAFYKGTENTRKLNVYGNGVYHSQIESSGTTNGYQSFYLDTDETEKLTFHLDHWESNPSMWLSITEVGRPTRWHAYWRMEYVVTRLFL